MAGGHPSRERRRGWGGVAAIAVGVWFAGWVFTLQPMLVPLGVLLAMVISVVAGLYPAARAARLEPLETLRLG